MDKRNDVVGQDGVGRRDLLRGLVVAGVGGTVLAAASGSPAWAGAVAASQHSSNLTLDVACLVDTLHVASSVDTEPKGPADGQLYGTSFLVEGVIYEGRYLDKKGPNFDPRKKAGIGTWLCRGWIILRPGREEPHVVTSQSYLLPTGNEGASPFPLDQLASEGLEGGNSAGWASDRIVLGGTGHYAGVRGTVRQQLIGTNATTGPEGNGPNFRFTFDLL